MDATRPPQPNLARLGTVVLVVSAVLFGAMAVLTRVVSATVPSSQVAAIRFVIGIAGAGSVALLRPSLFVATRPRLLMLRGFFGALSVLGYFYTIQHVSTGLATLLNYTFPVWGAVFAAVFLDEKLTARVVAGLGVSLLGLVTVVGPDQLTALWAGALPAAVGLGLALGFVSSVSAGAATTVVRALRKTDSALAIFLAFCTVGLCTSLPLAWRDWVPVPAALWLPLLGIGLLSLAAQVMFTWSFKHVETAAGGVITQLTVVTSYLMAWAWLDEPIGARTLLGALLVTTGVVLVSRGRGHA